MVVNPLQSMMPEVWSPQTSSDVVFFPGDVLPGVYCSCLHVLLVLSSACEMKLSQIHVIHLAIPLLCLKKSWAVFVDYQSANDF